MTSSATSGGLRISELSRVAGVALPTVKYYLREGLLAPGEPRGPNQAVYGDAHVRRLRLIRSLTEVGGLPLAAVHRVLDAVDDEEVGIHDAFGVVQDALSPVVAPGEDRPGRAEARAEVDRWLRRRRWRVRPDGPARDELADALAVLRRSGWAEGAEAFDAFADRLEPLAAQEVAFLDATKDRGALMEDAVVGTVVFERVMGALRRLALEHHSARRFGGGLGRGR